MNRKTVAILGEGAWGTAVATLLAHNAQRVNLWCYHANIAQEITELRTNSRYMPKVTLSPSIYATADVQQAVDNVDCIFIAIPVVYLRSVCLQFAPYIRNTHVLISLSKGIEKDSLLLPTEIMNSTVGTSVQKAVVSGPSFAKDLVHKQLTGLVVATDTIDCATHISHLLRTDFCRPTISSDIRGVQLCGAIKNVIALGIGMLDGAQYSDNTKALFIIQCIVEVRVLMEACGGMRETLYGLAGMGDIMLTAYGTHGRNLEVGRRIGRGEALASILASVGYTSEGINTAVSIRSLASQTGITMPLCQAVCDVLYNNISVIDMVYIMNT